MERTHKNQIVFVSTERFIQIISSKISEHVGSSGISHEPISLIGELFTSRISNALCSNHSAVIEEINIAFAHGLYPTYCRDGQHFLLFQKLNQLYFTLVKCFCTPRTAGMDNIFWYFKSSTSSILHLLSVFVRMLNQTNESLRPFVHQHSSKSSRRKDAVGLFSGVSSKQRFIISCSYWRKENVCAKVIVCLCHCPSGKILLKLI